MTFSPGDVIVVPFPFTDRKVSKRRPAIVLSTKEFQIKHNHCALMMITSAKNSDWKGDISIKDIDSIGLTAPSVARLKLFTLDSRLIIRKIGTLNKNDKKSVSKSLKKNIKLNLEDEKT